MSGTRHFHRGSWSFALALSVFACANGQAGAPTVKGSSAASGVAETGRVPAADGGCDSDVDCTEGFCDLGACAVPQGIYGASCTPAPTVDGGVRDGKLHTCGAYLCIDARCRSCVSDEQCRAELGSPKCYEREASPGQRCGNPP